MMRLFNLGYIIFLLWVEGLSRNRFAFTATGILMGEGQL